MSQKTIVELFHYSWTYCGATEPALIDVSFSFEQGEVIAILGASGSGKTTLALASAGAIPSLIQGTALGQIILSSFASSGAHHSSFAAVALQDASNTFVTSTVLDEMAFVLENECVPAFQIRSDIQSLSSRLQIDHLLDRSPLNLSGGEKQLVALASILLSHRQVYVIDDALTQIDENRKSILFSIFDEIASNGSSVLITATNLSDLPSRVSRLYHMSNGKLALIDSTKDQRTHPPVLTQFAAIPIIATESINMTADDGIFLQVRRLSYKVSADVAPILNGIILDIPSGERLAVVGRNGSGKSTLLRCIAGLLEPSSGEIHLRSETYTNRTLVGTVLQFPDTQLFCRSVRDEIALSVKRLCLSREDCNEQIDFLLHTFDLYEYRDIDPYLLSKGKRQALAVAVVLAARPSILILDEPCSAIDRDEFLKMLGPCLSLNIYTPDVLILAVHSLDILVGLCKRVVGLNGGVLEFDVEVGRFLHESEYLSISGFGVSSKTRTAK